MTKKKTGKKTSAKKTTAKKPAKKVSAKSVSPKKSPTKKKLSAIDAADKILRESKTPLTTKAMIEKMAAKKLWKSPGGKTPHATLYAAILRDIQKQGTQSRFQKVERGKFASR